GYGSLGGVHAVGTDGGSHAAVVRRRGSASPVGPRTRHPSNLGNRGNARRSIQTFAAGPALQWLASWKTGSATPGTESVHARARQNGGYDRRHAARLKRSRSVD